MTFQTSDIHNIADGIVAILSLPLLGTMATIIAFAFKVKGTAENTASALKSYADAVTKTLEDHDRQLSDHDRKVSILWDGHERRHGVDDRRQG
jgi:hypothetical protein